VGEVEIDLRGEPARDYSVEIRGGVGEATVYLPKDAGISATARGGIGDLDVEGLEERGGVWVNPERLNAPVTVRLDIKSGIGEIHLIR
jgi:predicted membrane protein